MTGRRAGVAVFCGGLARVVIGVLFLGAGAADVAAQETSAKAKPDAADQTDQEGTDGAKTQKIRSGSWIRRTREQGPQPDLRSEFEKRRDRQAAIHFDRLAVLEVVEELARKGNREGLAAKAGALRRRERERFRLALAHLNRAMRQQLMARGKSSP